jgi:hypothetical protein
MSYDKFIKTKTADHQDAGFESIESQFPDAIFPHQSACVKYACKRGRAGLFLDTGLGKTITQLTWADQVARHTNGKVLVLAPLAVASQTEREGAKFGIKVKQVSNQSDIDANSNEFSIFVTNYEKLDHFNADAFSGIVLDESSILKGMMGKMRQQITDFASVIPYRLSCTATPSPNDFMEIGTQSEFLGVMTQVEMLATYFIHDGGDTAKWRLKGHGRAKFFEWMATWAVFLTSPSDIGYDGSSYVLPSLHMYQHTIETTPTDSLFVEQAQGLLERNKARKDSVMDRCKKAAEIVNALDDNCVVWCHLNEESELLTKLINGAVEVKGSDSPEHKTKSVMDFCDGKIKCLVSKPKIAGFGINMQSSHHAVFVGLSDSWESYYQAVRRQWRFGQQNDVHVHIIAADTEGAVVDNIRRKDAQHKTMMKSMMQIMKQYIEREIFGARLNKTDYDSKVEMELPSWI